MTKSLKKPLKNTSVLAADVDVSAGAQAMAQVARYEDEICDGRLHTARQQVDNMKRCGFNDGASSPKVAGQSGQRWEICEDAGFGGRCAVLQPSGYPSLASMRLANQIFSVCDAGRCARIDDSRYAPLAPVYDSRKKPSERLYEANVSAVSAVVGPSEQRCWVEREQVPQERNKTNIPATTAGALIGEILGYPVGNGRGNGLATVGGAIAGGVAGNPVSLHHSDQPTTCDVQRCDTVPSQAAPALWDVTFNFRVQDHRIQMTNPSGSTVTVNRRCEPRVQCGPEETRNFWRPI